MEKKLPTRKYGSGLDTMVNMKIGIIDCGTNTFNLLVAEVGEGKTWKLHFENKLAVKLGAGGFEKKTIIPSRFIRGLDALQCHVSNAANFECQQIRAFATSAIREASNGQDFVKKAKELLNLDIEVIDGDREAELIYKGIKQTIDLGNEPSLIMDIGGGSTEFIIANGQEIFWKKSFLLGVSRVHEAVQPSDRMNHEDIKKLRNLYEAELKELEEALRKYPCVQLIGSSGSFDTLYAIYKHQTPSKINEPFMLLNELPWKAFPDMHSWLMGSTYEERLKHPAIPSIRAEYMPLASYLVKYVLELNSFERIYHSAYALKEGVISELISA